MLTDTLLGVVECNEGCQMLRLTIYFPVAGVLAWTRSAEGTTCRTV